MLDPITAVLLVLPVCSYLGYRFGKYTELRNMLLDPEGRAAYKSRLEEANCKLERVTSELKDNETWAVQWRHAAEANAADRDKFKKMAATHDVKWPEPPKAKVVQNQMWDERRYSNHPVENLKALAADLAQFKGREVHVVISLVFVGGWAQIVANRRLNQDNFKKMVFEGPPERVVAEITTFMHDHDMPFMSPVGKDDKYHHAQVPLNPDMKLKWNDIDSPMVWKVGLSVTETVPPPTKPEIHIVEVPIVETKVVEIVKPVKIVEHEAPAPVDKEQLAALVEVAVDEVLARKAFGRTTDDPKRRAAAQANRTTG